MQAEFVRSAFDPRDFLCDGLPEIAFVGRSNVGKSSLLNRLLGRRALARTSSTPGRTRAVNYFLIGGDKLFVDLPGFGYARASKAERREWGRLVESYFEQARGRTHIVQLVDAKVGATPLDLQAYEYLTGLGYRPTLVATKIDRIGRGRRHRALGEIAATLAPDSDVTVIPFSAKSGEGARELWREITSHLNPPPNDPPEKRGSHE